MGPTVHGKFGTSSTQGRAFLRVDICIRSQGVIPSKLTNHHRKSTSFQSPAMFVYLSVSKAACEKKTNLSKWKKVVGEGVLFHFLKSWCWVVVTVDSLWLNLFWIFTTFSRGEETHQKSIRKKCVSQVFSYSYSLDHVILIIGVVVFAPISGTKKATQKRR